MKLLMTMFAAMMAFYILFAGYAAWFFFLDGKDEWAKAAAFVIMAAGIPLAPGLVAWRRRAKAAFSGQIPGAGVMGLDSAAAIDDNAGLKSDSSEAPGAHGPDMADAGDGGDR